jgi:hypothetical protein
MRRAEDVRRKDFMTAGWLLLTVSGAAATFVCTTLLTEELPDVVTALVVAVGAAGAGLSLHGFGFEGLRTLLGRSPVSCAQAAVAGVMSFWLAPLIVLWQRASDAPPGSETLFFSVAVWGFIGVLAAAQRAGRAYVPLAGSGALLALVGAAGVLANWERPSSFSPFVRFPSQHLFMVAAGVAFAVGALLLLRAREGLGTASTLAISTAAAGLISLLLAVPALPPAIPALERIWPIILVLAVSQAIFVAGWYRLLIDEGLRRASTAWLLVPAALTGLSFLERALSVYGPDPILWPAASSGILMTLLGALAVWSVPAKESPAASSVLPFTRGVIASVLAAAGLATLAAPALRAEVEGAFEQQYRAVWTMSGVEAASGWLVVASALLVAAALLRARDGSGISRGAAALSGLLSLCTYPLLADTPFRTATRWVPADVQQTLGTEYARITFTAIHDPARLTVMALTGVIALIALAGVVRDGWATKESGKGSE